MAPLVRYVEAKCLVAGVTTSQGIALYSDAGIRRFYQGVVRNVEEPDDPALPAAQSRIPDVAAGDVDQVRGRARSATTGCCCTWPRAPTIPPAATSWTCSSPTGAGRSRTT